MNQYSTGLGNAYGGQNLNQSQQSAHLEQLQQIPQSESHTDQLRRLEAHVNTAHERIASLEKAIEQLIRTVGL